MKLTWATDIHLDHCDQATIAGFISTLKDTQADAFCLTGDLSEAPQLEGHLEQIADGLQRPVYFILGNHDYYHGKITDVRKQMQALTQNSPWLRWLPATGLIPLSDQSVLLGHDCWGDGRNGDVEGTWVKLTDFRLIEDFVAAGESGRVALLNRLGDEGAQHLKTWLPEALSNYPKVVMLMHPPPLREACLYGTEIADDNWAPHFTCKAVGDLILELLPQYPASHLTVLAGHTHNVCDLDYAANLRLCVGTAEYGQPKVAKVFDFP